jgi:hypothetical protein
MTMRKTALLAFILSSLSLHGYSSQNSRVEQLALAMRQAQAVPIPYPSFWEAMENLDLSYLDQHPADDDRRAFAYALRSTGDGDMPSAERKLREVYGRAQDPVV